MLHQHRHVCVIMSQGVFLDLLLIACTRPHTRCLQRSRECLSQTRHYALAHQKKRQTNSVQSTRPAPTLPRSTAASGNDVTSKVPLAVGLDRNPTGKSAISQIPIPKGVKGENFVPQPLARPLGLKHPPQVGQNLPFSGRSWSEAKAALEDREEHLRDRQVYLRTFLRPYFQDWKRLDKTYEGKSFVANERLFKKEKALYFPNLWGQTLAKDLSDENGGSNTTPAFRGKITVVGVQCATWAENQVNTFLEEKQNPVLHNLLRSFPQHFQQARINAQDNVSKQWLVRLFSFRLRNQIPEEEWQRYFMIKLPRDVRRGLTDEIRDAMGFLNTQVGYVYLLDPDCRIRWAGSGNAFKEEVESLNNGIKRLIADIQPIPEP